MTLLTSLRVHVNLHIGFPSNTSARLIMKQSPIVTSSFILLFGAFFIIVSIVRYIQFSSQGITTDISLVLTIILAYYTIVGRHSIHAIVVDKNKLTAGLFTAAFAISLATIVFGIYTLKPTSTYTLLLETMLWFIIGCHVCWMGFLRLYDSNSGRDRLEE